MKRFIDIENNIKKFIDDYNINYNQAIPSDYTEQSSTDAEYDLEATRNMTRSKNLSSDDITRDPLPRSLSHNSINSNATLMGNICFDKWAMRKCKSESDLIVLLNNKNYSYYWEELSNITNKMYVPNDSFVFIYSNQEKEQKLVYSKNY